GPGLYFVSPLYIYFLAGILAIAHSYTFVRIVQIALGTGTVLCVFVMARVWFGEIAAWAAAVLAALTGLFTFFELLIQQSSIDGFLTAAALVCLTFALLGARTSEGPRPNDPRTPQHPPREERSRNQTPPAGEALWFNRASAILAGVIFGL